MVANKFDPFAMKWHDVLKESVSPGSFKEINLSVLCVERSGRRDLPGPFRANIIPPFLGVVVD